MRKYKEPFTPKRLARAFRYDPETGEFYRLEILGSRSSLTKPVAPHLTSSGHRRVSLYRKLMLAHRVAFCLMTGRWPRKLIDHINGDPADNRWCNLREATHQQNICNGRPRKSKSGLRGAHKASHWRGYSSRIRIGKGRVLCLGSFLTAEEAHAAYVEAAKKYHGEFARLE